jgi:putative PEP-CTERM system histidine kinase
MIVPPWFSIAPFLGAMFAGGLACWLSFRKEADPPYRSLAVLLGAISINHIANGLGLLDYAHALFWRRGALAAELFQPPLLFYAATRFLSPIEPPHYGSRRRVALIIGVIALFLAWLTMSDQVLVWTSINYGDLAITLGSWGHAAYGFIIVGMALGLAQLESVLRASREPVRYRLKMIVIGMGGLAGYQIYQASQVLLAPIWRPHQAVLWSVVTLISLSVLAIGITRARFQVLLVSAYVSQQALLGSVTVIVIGVYLLVVGLIGEWLRFINQPLGSEFNAILVFAALLSLAIAGFSKSVRAEMRRSVARNFYRSKYDYRAEWLRVTETFEQAPQRESILDRLLDLLVKTFSTTTIVIWAFREADRCFVQVRPGTVQQEPIELAHPTIIELLKKDEPVTIGNGTGGPIDASDPLARLGAQLCCPIHAQGHLVAFILLGKQLHGEAYGTDDYDLLRGICHHVGALLAHAALAEERQAAAELEALHRFSIFCLHDLKNLAARLSLVAQNAEEHGRDPAFQESAMRTVADTAEKMAALMSKLSLKSFQPSLAGQYSLVDLSSVIEEIVAPLRVDVRVRIKIQNIGGPIRPIMAVQEQIHQVVLNVVLNARQAVGEEGDILVALERMSASIIIRVEDTGIGIPPGMLNMLFRPSQSSRPGGLGVGLYQCKRIVEAHGGTIQIRSHVGSGSQVQIELPFADRGDVATARAAISSSYPHRAEKQ